MKNKWMYGLLILAALSSFGCKKYLDYKPQGAPLAKRPDNTRAVDGLSTAAYAGIATTGGMHPSPATGNGARPQRRCYKGGGRHRRPGPARPLRAILSSCPRTTTASATSAPRRLIRAMPLSPAAMSRSAPSTNSTAPIPETLDPIGEMRFLPRPHVLPPESAVP